MFKGVLEGGGVVRGFNAGPREASRKIADELTEVVKRYGAGGLVWAVVRGGRHVALAGREGAQSTRTARRSSRRWRPSRATCC